MRCIELTARSAVRNFVGCLRSIYVNDVNMLRRLHRQSAVTATQESVSGSGYLSADVADDVRVVYGDDGWPLAPRRPTFGCHNLALSSVRLTRPGSLIQLPHQAVSDSFNFRMSFATVKPDGVLISAHIDDSLPPSHRGVIQVSNFSSIYLPNGN